MCDPQNVKIPFLQIITPVLFVLLSSVISGIRPFTYGVHGIHLISKQYRIPNWLIFSRLGFVHVHSVNMLV